MKLHYRLSVMLTAAALAVTASCGTSVEGAASAGDETTTSSIDSTTGAAPSEEAPAEEAPTEESPAEEAPVEESPASGSSADLDPATLAWADATCQDLTAMAGAYVAFPDVDGNASPEEFAIANIDFYDSLGTMANDRLADIHARKAPDFPRGNEIHEAYAAHMNALGAAAAEGAIDIELMHRSGSPEDLAAAIDRVQASVQELASADFAAEFMDDAELNSTMEAAMDAAPSCAALG